MTTYFFHLRDETDILLDEEGRSLPDLNAAVALALIEARHIIGADALLGHIDLRQRLDIETGDRRLVHCLPFTNAVAVRLPA